MYRYLVFLSLFDIKDYLIASFFYENLLSLLFLTDENLIEAENKGNNLGYIHFWAFSKSAKRVKKIACIYNLS